MEMFLPDTESALLSEERKAVGRKEYPQNKVYVVVYTVGYFQSEW